MFAQLSFAVGKMSMLAIAGVLMTQTVDFGRDSTDPMPISVIGGSAAQPNKTDPAPVPICSYGVQPMNGECPVSIQVLDQGMAPPKPVSAPVSTAPPLSACPAGFESNGYGCSPESFGFHFAED